MDALQLLLLFSKTVIPVGSAGIQSKKPLAMPNQNVTSMLLAETRVSEFRLSSISLPCIEHTCFVPQKHHPSWRSFITLGQLFKLHGSQAPYDFIAVVDRLLQQAYSVLHATAN